MSVVNRMYLNDMSNVQICRKFLFDSQLLEQDGRSSDQRRYILCKDISLRCAQTVPSFSIIHL